MTTITPKVSALRNRGWVWGGGNVLALLLLWFVLTNTGLVGPGYLPSPQDLFKEFWSLLTVGYQGRTLLEQISISIFRTMTGFAVGSVLGIVVGLLAGYSRVVGSALSPILSFIRPIPPIAFIPLVVLYFGLGEVGKIILITVTAFNYTAINAQAGASSTPIALRRAAATVGLNPRQEFFKVILPGALPSIFTGLRTALALSWAVVVAAELVGAQEGVGFMINYAALLMQIPVVFIGITMIGLIGLLLNWLLGLVEHETVHWKGH